MRGSKVAVEVLGGDTVAAIAATLPPIAVIGLPAMGSMILPSTALLFLGMLVSLIVAASLRVIALLISVAVLSLVPRVISLPVMVPVPPLVLLRPFLLSILVLCIISGALLSFPVIYTLRSF